MDGKYMGHVGELCGVKVEFEGEIFGLINLLLNLK